MSIAANTVSITTYAVGGGACISSAGNYVCALEKIQCANGWNFVSAMELENKYGGAPVIECLDDANIVPVGKCTQDRDLGICTGHMSNCEGCFETSEMCFQANVDSCALQPKDQGNGSINFASFGLCVNPAYPDRKHCLWSREECPQDDVWVTPNTWIEDSAKVDDFCTCDKVQVGACSKDNNFVCAVSADSCGDDQQYIGAKDLTDQYPNIDCRLCKDFSIAKDVTLNLLGPSSSNSQATQSGSQATKYIVAGGACVNDTNYVCALEKTQCADGWNFVSARQIELSNEDSPIKECVSDANIVPVGQCTQDRDNGICTGHMSNCEGCFETNDICFNQNVESCSIQPVDQGDGTVNFASFGLCVNTAYPDRKHCLWSRDECPQDDEWVTPNTWIADSATVNDFCTCDRVQVGACYTDDNFVCAVSADSCDDGQQYMGAKDLVEQYPNIDCRLCDDFGMNKDVTLTVARPKDKPQSNPDPQPATQSIAQPQVTTYVVAGGACLNSDGRYVCALEKTQCGEGWNFVSARQLEQGEYRNTAAIECIADANIVPVGQCTQGRDNGICTGHSSTCEGCLETQDVCFQTNVASCALQPKDQGNGSINFASFGLCVNPVYPDRKHCLWSRFECPQDDVWVTPNTWIEDSAKVDDFCTCDKVQVGACHTDDDFVCAVSADSCDDGQQYIGAKDLTDQYPNIDCRLCKDFSIAKDVTLNHKPISTTQQNMQQNNQVASQGIEYSVASGACVNEERYLCALEKTQCADGYDFVSAMMLEEKYRNTPAIQCLDEADIVPVGQCLQQRDMGICTGHMSNCEGCFESSDVCFQANVETCSLQPKNRGDGSLDFATFGLCVNPAYPDNRHCLWSRNECPQDDVWVTPNSWLKDTNKVEDFCTCDRVQIGACRKGDTFICAVSEDACDSSEEYIGAKALTELQPPIDCRLCKDFSIAKDVTLQLKYPQAAPIAPPAPATTPVVTPATTPGTVATYSVAAGACVNEFEYWCALEATQCAEGYEFVSARMLEQNYKQTPAIACLNEAKSVPVGQCTRGSDNGLCTGHMSNCQGCYETSGICFEPNNAVCKIEATMNQDGSVNTAGYGLCLNPLSPNDGKCLWSSNECSTTSTWITPSRRLEVSNSGDQCTCDKVVTGACRYGTNLICAVSADACDKDSVYVGSKELRDIAPSIDCRLCKALDPPILLSGPVGTSEPSKSSGLTGGEIVAITFTVVALLSYMGAVMWRIEKKRSRTIRNAEQEGMVINPEGSSINSSASSVASLVSTPSITINSDGVNTNSADVNIAPNAVIS